MYERRTEYNISLLRFCLDQVDAVEVPIDEFDAGVVFGDSCAFVAVADEAGDVVFWVGIGYSK